MLGTFCPEIQTAIISFLCPLSIAKLAITCKSLRNSALHALKAKRADKLRKIHLVRDVSYWLSPLANARTQIRFFSGDRREYWGLAFLIDLIAKRICSFLMSQRDTASGKGIEYILKEFEQPEQSKFLESYIGRNTLARLNDKRMTSEKAEKFRDWMTMKEFSVAFKRYKASNSICTSKHLFNFYKKLVDCLMLGFMIGENGAKSSFNNVNDVLRQFQRSFKNVFVDDVQPYFGQLDSFELKDLYAVLTAFTSLDYLHLTEALHSIRIEMPDATWTPLSEPEDLACLSDYRPNLHARITELFSFHDFSHEGSYGLNDFVFLEPPSYFKSECHFSDYLLYSLKCQNWVGVKTIDYDFCWIASDGISAVQVDLEGKYAIMRSPSWEWSVSQYLDLVSDRIAKFYQPLGKNDKVASEQVTFYMGLSAAGWGNYQQEDRSRWSGMNVEDFDPILHRTRENVANFDEY